MFVNFLFSVQYYHLVYTHYWGFSLLCIRALTVLALIHLVKLPYLGFNNGLQIFPPFICYIPYKYFSGKHEKKTQHHYRALLRNNNTGQIMGIKIFENLSIRCYILLCFKANESFQVRLFFPRMQSAKGRFFL